MLLFMFSPLVLRSEHCSLCTGLCGGPCSSTIPASSALSRPLVSVLGTTAPMCVCPGPLQGPASVLSQERPKPVPRGALTPIQHVIDMTPPCSSTPRKGRWWEMGPAGCAMLSVPGANTTRSPICRALSQLHLGRN